jgi:hypothetical protein
MTELLEKIVTALLEWEGYGGSLPPARGPAQGGATAPKPGRLAEALNHAFLITLAGSNHPRFEEAGVFLKEWANDPYWGVVAGFYRSGLPRIQAELENLCREDVYFARNLETLADWASNRENLEKKRETAEKFWSVFFPEAGGIYGNEEKAIEALRERRTVTIETLNPAPLSDPGREILFTSNVLLTIPASPESLEDSALSTDYRERVSRVMEEAQQFWYDHPVQVGTRPENNEILYGLRGLQQAFDYERRRGNLGADTRPTCVLSLSTTHKGLHAVAREYIRQELHRSGGLENMQVHVFTEDDTERLIRDVIAPAASHYLGEEDVTSLFDFFGVDGEYGRHYSFLKAIAAFWSVLIDPEIKATFKIDLDQVFPQKELEEETGLTAFGHFKTPLWGAHGLSAHGDPLEMGMIAGALVDEKDTCHTIFTPDVAFPNAGLSPEEYFFFSTLPQALSTEAEMMTCYVPGRLDGEKRCLQRIHVTGGTNGILVDSLCRYRPFTPSFIGRAEDQAYLLSVLTRPGAKLAYVHKDGLIMRHDKEIFAGEAIASAHVGKLIGDYIRILYFTAYAGVLSKNIGRFKEVVDPFTGCFISRMPATVAYLRFAFKAASLFRSQGREQGPEFVREGAERITKALRFADEETGKLRHIYEKERFGWDLYYDILVRLATALGNRDAFALGLREKANKIVRLCAISP